MTADFDRWRRESALRVESALERLLPAPEGAPSELHRAMRYAVLGGGKRLRALLVLAAAECAGAPPERALPAAAAVELIHAYSLVHDDLPCMDDDDLRRGKPTCHVEFGEATALLVGDALQSLAFEVLARAEIDLLEPDQAPHQAGAGRAVAAIEAVRLLAAAAGSRGMAGGQAMDLDAVGRALSLPELELIHIHKTGALIRAAVGMGALAGGLPVSQHPAAGEAGVGDSSVANPDGRGLDEAGRGRLDHYGKCVGLAFQVIDDVLDAEGNTATLGKTAGKDREQHKPTYASLMGAPAARAFAGELCDDALASLSAFGDRARRLREIAGFAVARTF